MPFHTPSESDKLQIVTSNYGCRVGQSTKSAIKHDLIDGQSTENAIQYASGQSSESDTGRARRVGQSEENAIKKTTEEYIRRGYIISWLGRAGVLTRFSTVLSLIQFSSYYFYFLYSFVYCNITPINA